MAPPPLSPARLRLADLLDGPEEALRLDLAAALLAAEERPGSEPEATLAELDRLARGLHVPEGASVFEGVARLTHFLFEEQGFGGDSETYDDPANSCLDRVLERRQGLPILLSLLAMEVGRRVGVDLVGIGFPGHFIVAPRQAPEPFFIDPFHAGRILRPEHLSAWLQQQHPQLTVGKVELAHFTRPVGPRAILVRMNQNLKASFGRRREAAGMLRAVQRLRLLQPEQTEHLRDEGLLLAELEAPREAAACLEAYLTLRPHSPQAEALRVLIDELREEPA